MSTENNLPTVVVFGELLWDCLPDGRELGGAPANLAFRLNNLGLQARLISAVGKDSLGEEALQILSDNEVATNNIFISEQHPTGTVDVTFKPTGEPDYVINTGVAYDHIPSLESYQRLAMHASMICFGTLIQRAPTSKHTLDQLLAISPNAKKFLDINLRKDCYTKQSIEHSLTACQILKLNEEELKMLAGIFEFEYQSLPAAAKKLSKLFNIELCIVTKGANGVYATNQNEEADVPGIKVKLADTIGSGDSFTAGFIYQYLKGSKLAECCKYANVIGAMNSEHRGAMHKLTATEIESCFKANY